MGPVIVILAELFVAPIALAAYIIVQDATESTLVAWFGTATAVFIMATIIGALSLFVFPI